MDWKSYSNPLRTRRRPKPKLVGESMLNDTQGRTFYLQPARVRTTYAPRETMTVEPAKRADEAWIVRTKASRSIVGVVAVWGSEEFCFQRYEGSARLDGAGTLSRHLVGCHEDVAVVLRHI